MLRRLALGAYCLTLLLAPAVAADAVNSYQGDDYSYDFNSRRQLRTCDRESDGKDVHGDYQRTNDAYGQVTDTDGANGNCADGVYYHLTIRRHRTCEEIDFWPDKCGNWEGTSP